MQVDWKSLAQSKGYKSLKAAYAHDIRKKWRSKEELQKLFKWVMGRAQHYAIRKGITMHQVIDEWEEKREQWWFGYYSNSNQPKLHSNSVKPLGSKGLRKYYRNFGFMLNDAQRRKNSYSRMLCRDALLKSTKSPVRWTSEYKKRQRRYRGL